VDERLLEDIVCGGKLRPTSSDLIPESK